RIMHLNIVKLLDSIIWFRGYVHSNTQKISLDSTGDIAVNEPVGTPVEVLRELGYTKIFETSYGRFDSPDKARIFTEFWSALNAFPMLIKAANENFADVVVKYGELHRKFANQWNPLQREIIGLLSNPFIGNEIMGIMR